MRFAHSKSIDGLQIYPQPRLLVVEFGRWCDVWGLSHMWRFLTIFFVGGALGSGFGVALGFFLFPYVFPPPEAMETLTASETTAVVARGEFVHANPTDPIHYGKGRVTVYGQTVFLEEDFEVSPGPKFHVYLVPKKMIRRSSDVENTMFVDLGRLRSFKGSQKYSIPNGVDLSIYPSVVVWCAEFGVLISPADLSL